MCCYRWQWLHKVSQPSSLLPVLCLSTLAKAYKVNDKRKQKCQFECSEMRHLIATLLWHFTTNFYFLSFSSIYLHSVVLLLSCAMSQNLFTALPPTSIVINIIFLIFRSIRALHLPNKTYGKWLNSLTFNVW